MTVRRPRLSVAPPLPPTAYVRRARRSLPFPLQEPGHRIYARARHGLYRGLQALGIEPGDEALVPAYHHGSEIETLVQAGLCCRFYDCDERLAPDAEQLEALRGPRTRLLHLIHYYGIPQDASGWRTWCDDRGLLLVEDAAQTWLASWDGAPVGSFGDLAIFCLHKSFAVPDGGALVARQPPPPAPPPGRLGVRQAALRHRDWLAQRGWTLAGDPDGHGPEMPSVAFALGDPDKPPSVLTRFLLRRLADPAAVARRHAHFERLVELLGNAVPEPFRDPPAGATPYLVLVASTRRRALLDHLEKHGIVGGALWQTPHPLLEVSRFPVAGRMRATLVGLPVHQELRDRDLARVAEVVRRFGEPVGDG